MDNSQKKDQVQLFLGLIREKVDRNGNKYFIGDLNYAVTLSMFKKNGTNDEWVVRLTQKEKRENQPEKKQQQDDPFGF